MICNLSLLPAGNHERAQNLVRRLPRFIPGQLVHGAKMKRFRRAGGHTGRFPAFHQPVHAEIAFLHLPVHSELRDTERAGKEAGAATDTFILVHSDDPVIRLLYNGPCGTHHFTGGIPAMEAGKGQGPVYHMGKFPLPEIRDPSPCHPEFDLMQAFAGDFTGVALDTTIRVKVESDLF
jgi:hypothetical protein